jgi:hypothetical protein
VGSSRCGKLSDTSAKKMIGFLSWNPFLKPQSTVLRHLQEEINRGHSTSKQAGTIMPADNYGLLEAPEEGMREGREAHSSHSLLDIELLTHISRLPTQIPSAPHRAKALPAYHKPPP